MTLDELKSLRDAGDFHHATYRNQGTLWEGLWIYRRSAAGFRSYEVAGSFPRESTELDAALEMVRDTGISVGAYGRG